MQPGDWFQLDLGEAKSVGGCEIELASWTSDAPRGLIVEASPDGENWAEAAAFTSDEIAAAQAGSRIRLTFGPVAARVLRFVQQGEAQNWWSVAELFVLAP